MYGPSIKMLELYYSHLQPIMVAKMLAGKKYEKNSKSALSSRPNQLGEHF